MVRRGAGPQHRAPVPSSASLESVLLSFSSFAASNGTTAAFVLLISRSAEHGQWYLPAVDAFWKQSTDPCPSRGNQTFHRFGKVWRWVQSSQCVQRMLKRKTTSLQAYLLFFYYPEVPQWRNSPFPNSARVRNVITVPAVQKIF